MSTTSYRSQVLDNTPLSYIGLHMYILITQLLPVPIKVFRDFLPLVRVCSVSTTKVTPVLYSLMHSIYDEDNACIYIKLIT